MNDIERLIEEYQQTIELLEEDRRKIDEEIFKLCEKSYTDGYFDGQKDRDMDIPPSIDDAYRRGYADAEKKHNSDLDYKNGLEDGRMEAWECARKIYNMTAKEVIAIFGGCSLWVNYSADEAIQMIKEYEQKQTDEMSMKDAINWMKDYFRTTDMPMPQYEKAFEMAIKSMEYIDDHAL